jgi:xylulokinase
LKCVGCGILVYDIGTTSVKSAVFSDKGILLDSVSAPYTTEYPQPGWAQQDPRLFWEAAVKGTRELLESPKVTLPIGVIGLTGHMNGCLPVDAHGEPVYPELIHSDTRSRLQCEKIRSQLGEKFLYQTTGNRTDEHLSLSKMLWLKEEQPEAFKKTAWFLNAKDYVRFKLTGNPGLSDFSDASLTGVFDINRRDWAWEIIDALGLSRSRFPELRSSIEEAGLLSAEAAKILGLSPGIPVSAGGGDGSCATRGAGVRSPGQAYASVGSSAWVSMLSDNPVFDPHRRIQNFFDLDGRSCNICGTVQSAGITVDWALNFLAGDAPLSPEEYRRIEKELAELPIGSDGIMFLPYLMGERTPHWDAAARGAFIGLSLSTDRNLLLHSVYEGVAFALKEVTAIYSDLSMPVASFTLLGGGIRSVFWRTVICDAIGIPMGIHPFPTHAISLGAAMAAGISAGIWPDFNQAIEAIDFSFEEIRPDHARSSRYEQFFPVYKALYGQLKPIFDSLGDISK